jgi:hypothetical protein
MAISAFLAAMEPFARRDFVPWKGAEGDAAQPDA